MAHCKGLDIFAGDGEIDFSEILKSGFSFCFCKCSEGTGHLDSMFARNWKELGEVGLTRGCYHYFRPAQDPLNQANFFLKHAAIGKSDLPAVIDIEQTDGMSSRVIRLRALSWIETVRDATHKHPIVYSSPSFLEEHGLSFPGSPLWIAHYGVRRPRVPKGWSDWDFWQNAEAGATSKYDTDFYNGSHEDMVARFGLR